MKRLFFERSVSCRDIRPDEINFIFDVLNRDNSWNIKWKPAIVKGESDWTIRLETQFYIDQLSSLHGHSASYPLVTPKITLLSLDEWVNIPEPRSVFDGLYSYRRYLVLLECARAFRLKAPLFRSAETYSLNNRMIEGAEKTDWMVTDRM